MNEVLKIEKTDWRTGLFDDERVVEKTFLDHALALAAAGYYVFPCVSGAKRPLVEDWENVATLDPEKIREWWTRWPDANIGSPPNRSGHFVIDLDCKNGKDGVESLGSLELVNGDLPATLTVTTPSGGYHKWFHGSAKNSASAKELGEGIDVRGAGGYVLMPGSKIDGKPYAFDGSAPIAEAPEWLRGLVNKPKHIAAETTPSAAVGVSITPDMLRAMLSHIDPDEPEQTEWVGMAKALRHGQLPLTQDLDADAWADILDDWCRGALWRARTGDDTFHPSTYQGREEMLARTADAPRETGPVTRLGTIISHAQAGGYDGPIAAPSPALKEAAQAVIDAAPETPADENDLTQSPGAKSEWEHRVNRFARVSLVAAANLPPLKHWDASNILVNSPEGYVFAVYGAPGSHKTNLIASLSFEAMRNGARVTYCAPEDAYGVGKFRIPAQARYHGFDLAELDRDGKLNLIETAPDLASPATTEDDVSAFIEGIRLNGPSPDIIVIDTLGWALNGADEDKAAVAYTVVANAKRITATFKSLIILICHIGYEGTRQRGSSAWAQVYDGHALVKADKDDPADITLDLHVVKVKNGPDNFHVPFKLASIDGVPIPVRMTEAEAAQSKGKSGGITPGEVGAALKAMNAVKGVGEAVTTRVLAREIAGTGADEATVLAKDKCLQRGAALGKRFSSYVSHLGTGGRGEATMWIFPHETEVANDA